MRQSIKVPMVLLATVALSVALTACAGDDSGNKTVDPPATAVTHDATVTDAASPAPDNDSAAAWSGDVCQLLDNDTITSLTGVDFSTAVATEQEQIACTWDLSATDGPAMVFVMVSSNRGSSYDISRTSAENMFGDVTDVSVAGAKQAFTYMGGKAVQMDMGAQSVQVMFIWFDTETADTSRSLKLAEEVARNW